jgi:hypothetical protein
MSSSNSNVTISPTLAPTIISAEVVHEYDAVAALSMNVILILCLLAAYYVKHFRYYHLPESSISLMVGVVVGGIVRIVYATTPDHLQLWEFVRTLKKNTQNVSYSIHWEIIEPGKHGEVKTNSHYFFRFFSHQKYFSLYCYHR